MSRVWVFTDNNARFVKHPDHLALGMYRGVAVKNPDLSKVRGMPPHLWALVDGKVVPKDPWDRVLTKQSHALNGVDNNIHHVTSKSLRWNMRVWALVALAALIITFIKLH